MTTNIQLLRSSVAYKRPSAAPLLDGQAAINFNAAEPGLFWRLTNGQLCKAGPVAVTDNGMEPNAAPAGETGNSLGETWLDAHPALHSPILHVFNGTEFVTANGFTVDKSTGNLTMLRQLEVTKLIAGSGQFNGAVEIGGNLTPQGQNCAFYVGLPNERWDYFYGCNLSISFDGNIRRDLFVDRNVEIHNNLQVDNFVNSNLTPDTASTRYLGVDTNRWLAYTAHLDNKGNTILGTPDALCQKTLDVHAQSKFHCDTTFESGTVLFKQLTTFDNEAQFNAPILITQVGKSCSDATIFNALVTHKCVVTFEQKPVFPDGGVDFKGTINLGDGNCGSNAVNLKGNTTLYCDMMPSSNNARSIGSDANRLKAVYATDVYTGDLHLKNEHGDWTMIEAENYMTLRNNKTGKTFRLLMEEV